ncbi:hypothetical protein SEMRO_304_G112500.1 [Seminavis robusta]|uniref:Uncharacterized protein n=1 Tax=Seminavis robusta TaxID=568900 RepID=A0A9N8DQR2_9STRA|nr:hypothetical protein SEMRO_304_G112500.1 [Seminavis robusta]|eukprot:Sro304_g112500.1 n/a (160) ;mRNA; r:1760-2239
MNDREEDQPESPQVLTPLATTAATPTATALKASNPTANTITNTGAPVQQDVAPSSPNVELAPTYPAAATAKFPEPTPNQGPASASMQQVQTSISPALAPSAVSSPSDANSLPSFVIVSPSQVATGTPSTVSPTDAGPMSSGPTKHLGRNPTLPSAAMGP